MTGRQGARSAVVVAVDDAGTAAGAVDWASAEAATRRCPLHIVHAVHTPVPDPYCVAPATGNLLTARSAAELLLRNAASRARSVASDIEIVTAALGGAPGPVLLGRAADAQLLVLGRRARHGLRGLLTRSVSIQVAAHACCPVVVIGPAQAGAAPGWSPPRVVVGVDATRSSGLGFAFGAARQRGLPLFAVLAWAPDRPADLEGVCGPGTETELLARHTLERALQRWVAEFPDVVVHAMLVRGDPAQALIAQSPGAALLVVGTRGRGHLKGTMLGSVSQSVLRHGRCPVAVVHDAPVARAGHRRGARPGRGTRTGWPDTPGDRRPSV